MTPTHVAQALSDRRIPAFGIAAINRAFAVVLIAVKELVGEEERKAAGLEEMYCPPHEKVRRRSSDFEVVEGSMPVLAT